MSIFGYVLAKKRTPGILFDCTTVGDDVNHHPVGCKSIEGAYFWGIERLFNERIIWSNQSREIAVGHYSVIEQLLHWSPVSDEDKPIFHVAKAYLGLYPRISLCWVSPAKLETMIEKKRTTIRESKKYDKAWEEKEYLSKLTAKKDSEMASIAETWSSGSPTPPFI